MKQQLHFGIKAILSSPMARLEYNNYRGWKLPSDENGSDEGFLVEYLEGGASNHENHKGYISWSPSEVFNNAYKPSGSMSFGMATEAARMGCKVARSGWNGTKMFAYIVPTGVYPAQTDMIKDHFPNDMVPYREYWALKTAQDDIATWAPSGSDSLADDWCVVEGEHEESYQDRVIDELDGLLIKIEKLCEYLKENKDEDLSMQKECMTQYAFILSVRIDKFNLAE